MTYAGINWAKLEIPFGIGLNQKVDDRSRPTPYLDICKDVQFDELGGLQTRYPFSTAAGSIFGGGSLANCRRIVPYGNELVLFTKDTVYSWNAQLSKWVSRGTHLAVKVTEEPRFVTTGDQIDGDRAELNGTILYAWVEAVSGSSGAVKAAALDKATGSVLVSPTTITPVATFSGRPRLVALSTKILLFMDDGSGNLTVRAIDPADPATGFASAPTNVIATVFSGKYDVVRIGSTDQCVGVSNRNPTTSYNVWTVTAALSIATATKARTCDGPIAVAETPTGTQTQVVRGNGTNVQGDLLTTSTFADVFTGQALGTASVSLNQIAVEFATAQVGGFYVASVFWSRAEASTGSDGTVVTNTVNTNNAIGAAVNLVVKLGLASRAFVADGRVFVWCVFARSNEVTGLSGATVVGIRAQLQNSYFLYRDDGLLVSRAVSQAAGGHVNAGRLPGVTSTSGSGLDFAWCGNRRRIIDLGGTDHTGYEARSPVDIKLTFDSNEARRCSALGRTLYVADGIPVQFDGTGLFEVGALVYPYQMLLTAGGAGSIPSGVYNYKSTTAWQNAQGEHERSTTAFAAQITAPGANRHAIVLAPLNVTRKPNSRAPTMEVWRTAVAPTDGAPFYLVTGKDPTQLAGSVNNGYIPNDLGAFVVPSTGSFTLTDDFTDAILITKEQDADALLENLAPPGASIIIATDTRLFLAGVAGDPHRVWYSKQRQEGEIAAFHEQLTVDVPRPGGDITSIAFLDEVLYAFRQSAIYALPGVGFDNFGNGQNYGPARIISLDVGAVSHESVALTPMGLIFKSSKGWYMLHGNGAVEFIGDKVADYDAETVNAVNVVETQHQVRILTSGRMLIWDYRANQWGEWSISDGVHACMFGGAHVYLTSSGTRTQQTTYTGVDYGWDVEMTWIKPAELQGACRVRRVQPLGEYRSAFSLRMRVAYNYQVSGGVPVYVDDKNWTPSPATVGGPLQVKLGLKRPQCEAFKLRLTAENADGLHGVPNGEAARLTSLALLVGIEPGLFRRLPAAQKV